MWHSKIQIHSNEYQFDFTSFFSGGGAPYPPASRWVVRAPGFTQKHVKKPVSIHRPLSKCLIQGLITNEIHLTLSYWRWLQKSSSSKIEISIVVNSSDEILAHSLALRSPASISSVWWRLIDVPFHSHYTGSSVAWLQGSGQNRTGWESFCWQHKQQ